MLIVNHVGLAGTVPLCEKENDRAEEVLDVLKVFLNSINFHKYEINRLEEAKESYENQDITFTDESVLWMSDEIAKAIMHEDIDYIYRAKEYLDDLRVTLKAMIRVVFISRFKFSMNCYSKFTNEELVLYPLDSEDSGITLTKWLNYQADYHKLFPKSTLDIRRELKFIEEDIDFEELRNAYSTIEEDYDSYDYFECCCQHVNKLYGKLVDRLVDSLETLLDRFSDELFG